MTTSPVYSERWFRVGSLRPRLGTMVRIRRQVVRGETWMLLSGHPKQPAHRLDHGGWAFVGRCDGRRTVDDIWRAIVADNADDSPTQDEIIGLLMQLHDADLIDVDNQSQIAALERRRGSRRRRARRARLNPLGFRATLGNPGAMLDRLAPLQRLLFSRTGMAAWIALVAIGLFTWIANWDEAADHAARWLTTPRYLLIAWLCYPVIKLIHETSHGLAIRRWGGDVREWGLALLFLTPLPYVDASDASLLPNRAQRALVSAAGIMAELAMAALSLLAWSQLEPGLMRDVMFSIALTCSLSTVLFNANPLMRLDGYYLMCDLLHLPNLAMRSSAWWQAWLVRHLLGLRHRRGPRLHRAERRWLVAYAPLSWGYRVLASVWLVMWAGASHPTLGVAAAVAMTAMVIVIPGWRTVTALLAQIPAGRGRHATRLRLAGCLALAFAVVPTIPLPDRLMAQGVVWIAEQGRLRAGTAGFMTEAPADGRRVTAGEAIVTLSSPELDTSVERLAQRRHGLMAGLYQSLIDDPYKRRQYQEDIVALDEQAALLAEQRRLLALRAHVDGRVAIARPQDGPGRFVERGTEVGVIYPDAPMIVRVAVEQEDAARLADAGGHASVRLAGRSGTPIAARIVHIDPAAGDRLPSNALSAAHGGDVVTDPSDRDGLRPVRPIRLVDVELPIRGDGAAGSRAWVRFDFGWRSLGAQMLRHARQQFLVHFSPVES